MKVYPWDEVVGNAKSQIKRGNLVYQQFNCEHCGVKQTMDVPNSFYELGQCEQCSKITDIRKHGHNFMMTVNI